MFINNIFVTLNLNIFNGEGIKIIFRPQRAQRKYEKRKDFYKILSENFDLEVLSPFRSWGNLQILIKHKYRH
jgi:hypothetical protein